MSVFVVRAGRITQVNRPEHLIASHCKPWRDCESNDERLDGENGLLLLKQDVAVLRQEMENRFALLAHEIAALGVRMTARLGSTLGKGDATL